LSAHPYSPSSLPREAEHELLVSLLSLSLSPLYSLSPLSLFLAGRNWCQREESEGSGRTNNNDSLDSFSLTLFLFLSLFLSLSLSLSLFLSLSLSLSLSLFCVYDLSKEKWVSFLTTKEQLLKILNIFRSLGLFLIESFKFLILGFIFK